MSDAKADFQSAILNIFAGKNIKQIVFSPRIYYWYLGNRLYLRKRKINNPNIPSYFLQKTQLEIFDILRASPRYSEETLYLPLLRENIMPKAKIKIIREKGAKPGESVIIYKTPRGILRQVESIGGGLGAHITEYPIKTIEDLDIMKYILENTKVEFLERNFEKAEQQFGKRCVVSTYISKSPYQKLVTQFIGFIKLILLLKRFPSKIENFMKFLEQWDNQLYDQISKSSLKIVNFGENLDANLSPPPFFEKYLIPYYEKRVKQLHHSGKYCHVHIDGSLRDFLPYFQYLPFDGLEALTAKPQGDVSLEEIKDSIGDKILLDGIPSILFLKQYSNDYLKDYVRQILDLFSPKLILGISDELSPNGDIRKVEMISEIINKM
ncbi:MAG: hypothetical protein EAX89_14765 [Candidatus Lokiarchaeota archaeon]|nr:hypothetical protein [Candidatus Lokiarchaeota archaeon]